MSLVYAQKHKRRYARICDMTDHEKLDLSFVSTLDKMELCIQIKMRNALNTIFLANIVACYYPMDMQ